MQKALTKTEIQKAATNTESYVTRLAEYLTGMDFECSMRQKGKDSYQINAIGHYKDVVNVGGAVISIFPEQEKLGKKGVRYKLTGFGDCIKPMGIADTVSAQETYEMIIGDSKVTVQVSTKYLDINSKRI